MSFSNIVLGGTDFVFDNANKLVSLNLDEITLKRDAVSGVLHAAPEETTYSTAAPTTHEAKAGDTWYVTPLGTKEDRANATASYRSDGTVWVKTPGTLATYTVVYFDTVTPSTATLFDIENPPVTNNNALKNLDSALYISAVNNSSWNSNGTVYSTYTLPPSTAWNLAGSSVDAGSSKTAKLSRTGWVSFGSDAVPLSTLDVNGSLGANIRTLADSSTLTATDFTVLLPDGMTATLPSPALSPKRILIVKNAGYAGYVAGFIEGLNQTITLGVKESIVLQSNGIRWAIIASYQGNYEASQQGLTGQVKVGAHTYYVSDSNWTSPLTLPASAPYIGFDLMIRVNSSINLAINVTNTDMASVLSIPKGKSKCFKWSGSYWVLLN